MKVSIGKLKEQLSFYLRKKQVKVESLRLKKERSKKESEFIDEEQGLINTVQNLIDLLEGKYLGRIPPTAIDLEEVVIGAIILEPHAYHQILFLEAAHFYKPAHQEIFATVQHMHRSKIPVDMRTVVQQLRKAGKLEVVGGAHFIAELTSKLSSAANVEYHARVLIEYAIRRELINLAGSIINDAYEDTTDVFELLEAIDQQLNKIKEPINQPQHV